MERVHPDGRFIPTHVGNTGGFAGRTAPAAVHPHARGEHTLGEQTAGQKLGSSPRTWGTLRFAIPHIIKARFIPTHVGNTASGRRDRRRAPVHPHARGEHEDRRQDATLGVGSSPRTWGTRDEERADERRTRFIPTHVGNTPRGSEIRSGSPVHPHARGEHSKRARAGRAPSGSSPRTWGTRGASLASGRRHRFIPTHVGNTKESRSSQRKVPVHPHARGEHSGPPIGNGLRSGSSPRTWGTRTPPRRRR